MTHYLGHELVVFVGAGVSRNDDGLGIGDWDGFLRRLAAEHLPAGAGQARMLLGRDPWEQADWLAERLGRDALTKAIYHAVRAPGVFQRGYPGLLQRSFALGAATLRAVAAFCVELAGYSTSVQRGRTCYYPRVTVNHRVPAILSTNYDPYLEAAASSMFRTLIAPHPLKPVGAVGSTAGVLGQTPVFHVHGYVPPDDKHPRTPIVNPVLTSQDYAQAWADRADSYTIGPQIHLLRHYSALFIGFSFRDQWVNGLLRDITTDCAEVSAPRAPQFAFIQDSELAARPSEFFTALGVTPIPWREPGDIVQALSVLYQAGLDHDMDARGPLVLAEFEAKRRPPVPTGRAVITTSRHAPANVWQTLDRAWRNPVSDLPGVLAGTTASL